MATCHRDGKPLSDSEPVTVALIYIPTDGKASDGWAPSAMVFFHERCAPAASVPELRIISRSTSVRDATASRQGHL
jgi:hypothetical protein